MLSIPFLARGFAVLLMFISGALALENTLISADVLMTKSGASALACVAIAVGCTGLELAFASWIIKDGTFKETGNAISNKPSLFFRFIGCGLVLALVYHFDITTTYLHPQFVTDNVYFFSAVVGSFVFGPEICLLIGWWLWHKAGDEETKLLAKTNSKAAENAFWKSNRRRAIALAEVEGRELANRKAAARWNAGEA